MGGEIQRNKREVVSFQEDELFYLAHSVVSLLGAMEEEGLTHGDICTE